MDWFNAQFRRDYNMCLVYPQVLPPGHVPEVDPRWGPQASRRWLTVLDRHMIGDRAYVCGNEITLADYLGIAFVTLAELLGFDYAPWPSVVRWIARMTARPGWAAARADPRDTRLLADLRRQLHLSARHLAHEDEFIHAALEARCPGASERLVRA